MPSMPISCSHYLLHTLKDTITGTHSADAKYALQKQRETVALTKKGHNRTLHLAWGASKCQYSSKTISSTYSLTNALWTQDFPTASDMYNSVTLICTEITNMHIQTLAYARFCFCLVLFTPLRVGYLSVPRYNTFITISLAVHKHLEALPPSIKIKW